MIRLSRGTSRPSAPGPGPGPGPGLSPHRWIKYLHNFGLHGFIWDWKRIIFLDKLWLRRHSLLASLGHGVARDGCIVIHVHVDIEAIITAEDTHGWMFMWSRFWEGDDVEGTTTNGPLENRRPQLIQSHTLLLLSSFPGILLLIGCHVRFSV